MMSFKNLKFYDRVYSLVTINCNRDSYMSFINTSVRKLNKSNIIYHQCLKPGKKHNILLTISSTSVCVHYQLLEYYKTSMYDLVTRRNRLSVLSKKMSMPPCIQTDKHIMGTVINQSKGRPSSTRIQERKNKLLMEEFFQRQSVWIISCSVFSIKRSRSSFRSETHNQTDSSIQSE